MRVDRLYKVGMRRKRNANSLALSSNVSAEFTYGDLSASAIFSHPSAAAADTAAFVFLPHPLLRCRRIGFRRQSFSSQFYEKKRLQPHGVWP